MGKYRIHQKRIKKFNCQVRRMMIYLGRADKIVLMGPLPMLVKEFYQ